MKLAGFDLTGPIGTKATLGLVVLQADETLEQDFHAAVFRPGCGDLHQPDRLGRGIVD
ncbi:hypothetical protein OEG86_21555 [Hoeflea alexandrii]|uniref:hypothetical protein n=1 Tax=Hoeflea alexandrii TaxID=288436 RepID=UPI0022709DD8|nr:hypothetical protein [Hoeflea alexandrii]MCY0154382.1 hypothetical protein [Hoeflea alexandrii]